MTDRSFVGAPGNERQDARAVERCGYWHWRGRPRAAVAYYDHPLEGELFIRTFVCPKHARQAKRDGCTVVWNGGVWPEDAHVVEVDS